MIVGSPLALLSGGRAAKESRLVERVEQKRQLSAVYG